MFFLADLFPKLPLGPWVDSGVDWLTDHLSGLLDAIQSSGNVVMDTMTGALSAIPVWLFIIGITIFSILMFGKKWECHSLHSSVC